MVEYTNRHWERNESIKFGTPFYELHFTEFYDDKVILAFAQDREDPEQFNYRSDMLSVEDGCVFAGDLDEAKEQFEEMIIDHIEETIHGYEEMLEIFNEVATQSWEG